MAAKRKDEASSPQLRKRQTTKATSPRKSSPPAVKKLATSRGVSSYESMDANNDGRVTRSEARASSRSSSYADRTSQPSPTRRASPTVKSSLTRQPSPPRMTAASSMVRKRAFEIPVIEEETLPGVFDDLLTTLGAFSYADLFGLVLTWWDVTFARRLLFWFLVATMGAMVVGPGETNSLFLLVTLHFLGITLRCFHPVEKKAGSFRLHSQDHHNKSLLEQLVNFHFCNGGGILFRLTVFLAFIFDFVAFMQLTPVSVVSLAVPFVRGQTLGMSIFGLQCVGDDPEIKASKKEPRCSTGLILFKRQLLNWFLVGFVPLTMLLHGRLPGSLLTGTSVVMRPVPREPQNGPGPLTKILKVIFLLSVPVLVGTAAFIISGTLLAGHGINGRQMVGQAWFTLTATSGAEAFNLDQYPDPHSELPQMIAKEGGAMWFGFAPHQLAHIDSDKYIRFVQQVFSLKNVLVPVDEAPSTAPNALMLTLTFDST